MTLTALTPEQVSQIKEDLRTIGVEGSALLAIPAFEQTADAHSYIREIMLGFLRSMFRSMPVGQYRWDAEDKNTEIAIHYADPRRSAEFSQKPAVTVELAPFTYSQSAINDFLGGIADGTKYYTALRNGAIVIRCRSAVKLEADSMAHAVMGAIKYMHDELEKLSGFTYVDAYTTNPSSGELQATSTVGEFFVANVVANVHYQESWKKPPNRIIRGPVTFVAKPKGIFLP